MKSDIATIAKEIKSEMKSEIATSAKEIKSDMSKKLNRIMILV